MRHNKSGRQLGRNASHRKALFRNMARSLLTFERIRTTEAKAKELRSVVEGLIALTQSDTVHARRLAYKVLENHQLVAKLFNEIGPRFVDIHGGYTRVVKLGLPRAGDCAPLAIIELTQRSGEPATGKTASTASVDAKSAPAPEAKAPVEA